MPNYFALAGEAIEEAVVAAQPDASGNWLNLKPKSDWGINYGGFLAFAAAILNIFAGKIAPALLDAEVNLDGFWDKPLLDLQWALAGSVAQ